MEKFCDLLLPAIAKTITIVTPVTTTTTTKDYNTPERKIQQAGVPTHHAQEPIQGDSATCCNKGEFVFAMNSSHSPEGA